MRRSACLTAAILVLLVSRVAADPAPEAPSDKTFLVWQNPVKLCLPDLTGCITVAPGYYLAQPKFDELDLKVKTLENQETRLKAENDSLKKSAKEIPILPIAIGVGVGLIFGTYIGLKF